MFRVNLTSDEPVWTVRGLEWEVRFRLVAVAVNSKGRSAPARLDDLLFPDPEKRTGIYMLMLRFRVATSLFNFNKRVTVLK